MSETEIKELVEQAPVLEPLTEPRPLLPDLAPAIPFPYHALPPILERAAEAIHQKTLAPKALCVQSVLAASALVAQSYVDITTLSGSIKPASIFLLTIAESGERKSTCDELAMAPIKQFEKALYNNYHYQHLAYENERDAHEAKRKEILKKRKRTKQQNRTKEEIQQELEELGETPRPPFECAVICEEPTFPALVSSLLNGHPSMGLFSDEGGETFGGYAMNKDNKLRTIAGYSKLWDGTEIKHKRYESGESRLIGKRLSTHLMVQPDIANTFLSDKLFRGQGYSARFFIACPNSTMGTRFYQEASVDADFALEAYNQHLLNLLKKPLPLTNKNPCSQELKPTYVNLGKVAKAHLIEFYNTLESQLRPNVKLRHLSGFVNKLPEHATRIATVLAFIENPQVSQLSKIQMEAGIQIAHYYLAQALHLYDPDSHSVELINAEAVKGWLEWKWKEPFISSTELMQRVSPANLRKADIINPALKLLVDYGWLTKLEEAKHIKGKLRKDCYQLHESLMTL